MNKSLKLRAILLFALALACVVPGMCCRGKTGSAQTIGQAEKVTAPVPADVFVCTSPGRWYPDNPVELKKMVDGYMSLAPKAPVQGRIMAVIAPHAGYVYSGPVAANVYKQLEGLRFDTVVVVGFNHGLREEDIAIYNKGAFRTPLGDIPIDTEMANGLMANEKLIKYNPSAFSGEHSLDNQLPFLQRALGDFKLVPILLTDQTRANIDALANALPKVFAGKNVLLVASSDMSHFWTHEQAKQLDTETLGKMLTLDPSGLAALLSADYEGRRLCGHGAVEAVMRAAMSLGADKAQLFKYADSQDTYGPTGNGVVGYGAVALVNTKAKNQTAAGPTTREKDRAAYTGDLDKDDQAALLKIARDALETYIRTGKEKEITTDRPRLKNKFGVFVTLNENGDLRGCMGHFENDTPLAQIVAHQAIVSATGDPRFPQVRPEELSKITIEISVLSVPQPVQSYEDIKIGTHGVILHKNGRGATFLPQVAPEQGWDRDTMLQNLSQKAGLPQDAWKSGATFEVYTAQVFGE